MLRLLSKSTPMTVIISLLLIVMIVAMILIMTGNTSLAGFVGGMGPLLILLGTLAFIVFKDSKKRWPHDTATRRLVKVLTLTR